ncbi:MAG: hypothetical protein RLZ37_790 [Actinomycetota bacterium]|jgi:hypothetical protein
MGLLRFDPDRLLLLDRAIEETVERLDGLLGAPMTDEIARRVWSARDLARAQQARLAHARSQIARRSDPPSCPTIATLAQQFSTWIDVSRHSIPGLPVSQSDHWWVRATTDESTQSDALLQRLGCDPDPGRAGLLIDSLEEIEVLVFGASDLRLVEDVWIRATDPLTTPPSIALERIHRLLDVVYDDRPWEEGLATGSIDPVERSRRERQLRELTARIVAPWQLELSRPDGEQSRSIAEGAHRLHEISRSNSAADILLAGLPQAVTYSLSNLPLEPDERVQRIDSVAHAIGTSLEIRRMSEVERAESGSDLDTFRRVIESLAIDGPWPISLVIEAGADWVDEYLDTSDERIRQATVDNLTQRQILASIAVVAVAASVMSRQTHRSRNDTHARSATIRVPDDLATELRHTYQAIDNAAGRGTSFAQLTSTRSR